MKVKAHLLVGSQLQDVACLDGAVSVCWVLLTHWVPAGVGAPEQSSSLLLVLSKP